MESSNYKTEEDENDFSHSDSLDMEDRKEIGYNDVECMEYLSREIDIEIMNNKKKK